jgi:3-hydroxyacyl-[acyl-carrier-protein] dehydratase
MHFNLVDRVLDCTPERIVTVKQVSAAEEYLQDHFPGFPVLPGVMMLEAMVQAGRLLAEHRGGPARLVLGQVRALKYGRFVRPGEVLRVQVEWGKELPDGAIDLKGEGRVLPALAGERGAVNVDEAPVAVSGRMVLRPVRAGG